MRILNIRKRERYLSLNYGKIERSLSLQTNTDIKNSSIKKIKGSVGYFLSASEKLLIHKIKYFPSHRLRNFFYEKVLLVERDKKSVIYFGCELRSAFKLKIGKGSIIGDNCIIDARGGVDIGSNVNLSSEVKLWTGSHDPNDPTFAYKEGGIVIEDRAWLSSNSIVLGNVRIGEGAVVCANAVVTKNVEPYTIVAGIPAKVIGIRNKNLQYEFKTRTLFI